MLFRINTLTMRAKDFLIENEQKNVTINIPITITIPAGGGMPFIGGIAAPAGDVLPDEPVMVPPLQQQIELAKQQGGKESKIINQIIADNGAASKVAEESKIVQAEAKKNYFNLSEDFDDLVNQFDNLTINGDDRVELAEQLSLAPVTESECLAQLSALLDPANRFIAR